MDSTPKELTKDGALVLRPKETNVQKLATNVVIAIAVNGCTFIFLSKFIASQQSGSTDWLTMMFLAPLIIISVITIAASFKSFLALSNPRPVLTLKNGSIKPGEEQHLAWELEGQSDRIENMRIYLEGVEQAIFIQGTRKQVFNNVFCAIDLAKVDKRTKIRKGSTKFSVPAEMMHSFSAPHNQIIWQIVVVCEIPNWPDLSTTYGVLVQPFEKPEWRQIGYDQRTYH